MDTLQGGSSNLTKVFSCSTHMHIARSCDACIRCWRPRFVRITLPCNYLGIMRELPTLSLHNHNPQPLRLNLDLPSLLLFWLLLSLFLSHRRFLSLISSLCLFVRLPLFLLVSLQLYRMFKVFEFSTAKWECGTAEHEKKALHCHSFYLLLSHLIVSSSLRTMLLFTLHV